MDGASVLASFFDEDQEVYVTLNADSWCTEGFVPDQQYAQWTELVSVPSNDSMTDTSTGTDSDMPSLPEAAVPLRTMSDLVPGNPSLAAYEVRYALHRQDRRRGRSFSHRWNKKHFPPHASYP